MFSELFDSPTAAPSLAAVEMLDQLKRHPLIAAVLTHAVDALSLAELADRAHVSGRHLTRLFAEHAGISVVGYQQQLRIARARELLADRQLSVERVAELAGFSSARDFRRVWQRHESGAPSAGRAALAGGGKSAGRLGDA